jgi:hypothetical protein
MCQVRVVRLANPLVRAVLRSRWHRLLSGRLLVLAYRGRRSGRGFAIPVLYAQTAPGGEVVVVALRREKLWWRSFLEPSPASLRLRGADVSARGAVAVGASRDAALAAFRARHPYAARRLGDAPLVVIFSAA